MSEAGRSTGNHTQPTALLDDKSTVYRSPQKRRRFSSTQQDSNASPLTTSAMDPGSKSTPANSDQTLPSEPAEQPPSILTPPLPASSLPGAPRLNTAESSKRRVEPYSFFFLRSIVHPVHNDDLDEYKWQELDSTIERFASTYYKDIAWESLDQSTKKEFLSWAPDAPKLCLMHNGSFYLFKSWIWRILVKSVLMGKCPDLIDWTSPYFKAQNDMQNALLDCNPQALTQRELMSNWNVWKFLSLKMFRRAMVNKPNPRVIDYRIEPASISKIIARGLGSNFPNELSDDAQTWLDWISAEVAKMEMIFNNALSEVRVVFHHPNNMKTSGFAFEPEIDGLIGQAMTNVDCWGAQEEKYLRGNLEHQYESGSPGRPVDFIVSPMVICSPIFYAYRAKLVHFPMTVCVDWVAEWDREMEERKEEEKQEEEEEKRKDDEKQEEEEETKAKGKGKAREKEE